MTITIIISVYAYTPDLLTNQKLIFTYLYIYISALAVRP